VALRFYGLLPDGSSLDLSIPRLLVDACCSPSLYSFDITAAASPCTSIAHSSRCILTRLPTVLLQQMRALRLRVIKACSKALQLITKFQTMHTRKQLRTAAQMWVHQSAQPSRRTINSGTCRNMSLNVCISACSLHMRFHSGALRRLSAAPLWLTHK